MSSRSQRYLAIYSGVLTLVFAVTVLAGAAQSRTAKFDEIDVQRLNLREPDGTLRFVLSSSARFPGLIVKGTEYPHPRTQAGMLFFNDEGTENGGLIFAGKREDGKVSSGGSLTFDQYEQDQVVQILGVEEDGRRVAGLMVSDRPERSIARDFEEEATLAAMDPVKREAVMQQRATQGYYGADRLFVGKNSQKSSQVELNDAEGHTRLRLEVSPEGAASIEFLDADGTVQSTLTPRTLAER